MTDKTKSKVRRACLALLASMALRPASAAMLNLVDFPAQPIKLVVPFPPGGSTDNIARLYADGLAKVLGQAVVIEHRPGAATNIGAEYVARAKPDGYTLLFGTNSLMMNAIFGPRPNFDERDALEAVGSVAEIPFLLAAHPKAPFSTPQELQEFAKAHPDEVSVSSGQLDLFVEQLELKGLMELMHVPYKGGSQATVDAVSGIVHSVFALVPVLLPQIQSGKLRAIGITSRSRLTQVLTDVPTFAEQGIDYAMTGWFGVQSPANLPAERLKLLNEATQKVVSSAEFVTALATMGAQAMPSTPQEMAKRMSAQREMWERLARAQPALVHINK